VKRSKTNIENGIPLPVLSNFNSKEKNSIVELIQLLCKWLVHSVNPITTSDSHNILSQLKSAEYFQPIKKVTFKGKIIKAVNAMDHFYIQNILNDLFYQLFDLDGNPIDYLMKEYYNV
jgi:hypothetical protein